MKFYPVSNVAKVIHFI